MTFPRDDVDESAAAAGAAGNRIAIIETPAIIEAAKVAIIEGTRLSRLPNCKLCARGAVRGFGRCGGTCSSA